MVRVLGATGRNARGFISAIGAPARRAAPSSASSFPVGKELEAKIIEIDPRRGEVKLSIKALNEETERNAYQTVPRAGEARGEVHVRGSAREEEVGGPETCPGTGSALSGTPPAHSDLGENRGGARGTSPALGC